MVDRVGDLRNDRIDVERVHPSVVRFLEDTASLGFHVRSSWRFPFSVAWRCLRWFFQLLGQFVFAANEGRITTRVLALDTERDGRPDARVVVRSYADTGDLMHTVAYATCEHAGARYLSAAFPMPGGHVAGILRLEPMGEDRDGRLAVVLTSTPSDDATAGIWFVAGAGLALPSPFAERLELWPPELEGAPRERPPEGVPEPVLVGRHEQSLFGFCYVVHTYWFWPERTAA